MFGVRIALIGGGAAAVSLIDGLLGRVLDPEHLDVVVYESGPRPGPGRAYRADLGCAFINTRTGVTSIRADEPGHFLDWLHTTPAGMGTGFAHADADSFLPRWVFGEYLADCLDHACHSGSVRVERQSVQRVRPSATDVLVETADGQRAAYDRVVLCVGGGEPAQVYGLEGAPQYHRDPYPLTDTVTRLHPRARVLVIGTGLTAVDTVLALRDAGHEGDIAMASRRGLLPAVRVSRGRWDLACLTPEALARARERAGGPSLETLGGLLLTELDRAGVTRQEAMERVRPGYDARARLMYQFREAETGAPWQRILTTAANRLAEPLWQLLPDAEKRRYLRGLHHVFQSECHPMPPLTAVALLDMMDDGQLTVRSGIQDVRARPGGGFVLDAHGQRYTFDAVVGAARQSVGLPGPEARPLVSDLVDQGAATPHPFGGIRVDAATHRVLTADGAAQARLHALGDLTAGTFYHTGPLEVISRHADRITDALLAAAPGAAEEPVA